MKSFKDTIRELRNMHDGVSRMGGDSFFQDVADMLESLQIDPRCRLPLVNEMYYFPFENHRRLVVSVMSGSHARTTIRYQKMTGVTNEHAGEFVDVFAEQWESDVKDSLACLLGMYSRPTEAAEAAKEKA